MANRKNLRTAVEIEQVDDALRVVVHVGDPAHPRLRATFTYLGVVVARRGLTLALVGFDVGPTPDLPIGQWPVISTTEVRRSLPLPRWQTAAHAAAVREWQESVALASRSLDDVQAVAGLLPDMAAGPYLEDRRARRRLDSALLLARVAREYRENVAAGLSAPVAAIARERGWSETKTRTLVRRARQKGFLGPAVGRVAGEK